LSIEILKPPTVAERIEELGSVPAKEGRRVHHAKVIEHSLFAEKFEEPSNRRDLDVIDNQQSVLLEMRVEAPVFHFRKWIGVRTIQENQLERMKKGVPSERPLCRPQDEMYTLSVEEGRLRHPRKARVATFTIVHREDRVILAEMGE